MAIDTTMLAATIPSGTYAVGDTIALDVCRGPKIVRDGYGPAKLKRILTFSGTTSVWKVIVKNSNWVDEMSNLGIPYSAETLLGNESGAIQSGQDADLMPNSGWSVIGVCVGAGTESNDADLICLIDVDYPSIAAVENPKTVKGEPVTVDGTYAITINARGTAKSATWMTQNSDFLKAGYKYLLTEASVRPAGTTSLLAFVSISGAAGQAGLERIIPARPSLAGLKYSMDFSTPLVKGPMNVNVMAVGTALSTTTAYVYFDFVKKKI